MAVKAIAHSYWRLIKAGSRTYESVPGSVRDDVRALAIADVVEGVITADEYFAYIGEMYGE